MRTCCKVLLLRQQLDLPNVRVVRPKRIHSSFCIYARLVGAQCTVEQALYEADNTSYLLGRNGNFADTYWPPIHYDLANKFAVLGGALLQANGRSMADTASPHQRFHVQSHQRRDGCTDVLRDAEGDCATSPCWNYCLLQERMMRSLCKEFFLQLKCSKAARVLSSFGMDELMLGSLRLLMANLVEPPQMWFLRSLDGCLLV